MGLTTARSKEELKEEIREVERLVELAKNVEREGQERKLNELRRCIDIEEIRNSDEKLLIFTEHKDTLDYLMEKVQQWGFSVTHIDGSMSMDERKQAEDDFKNKCQIMIATEAAGEGINLQFCKLMVNYDIPWNPTRLEQRMGRIHRYGQRYEVHIYNLIAEDTREGEVLKRILEKLELMREHLGKDRVYDVISEIFDEEGIKFEDVMKKAILNRITLEEFEKIDKIDLNAKEKDDAKEKDVSNIHYSFGFEETNDSYWVEIALNSVASVEQFLSMNDREIKEFFKLCKNKPPRMVLTLTKKTKTNFAGSTNHELLFEKEMCKLTEQDIKMVRVKANEINNLKDPLIKPFIGLCVVNYVSKEELADNFSKMEDVFEFIKSLIPRQQRYKNTLREEHQLEKRLEEVKAEIKHKTKIAEFMKNLGKFDDQEKLEKSIMSLEQELEEITSALQEKKEMLITLERDMGGRKNESTKAMVTDSSTA
jgi:superfamily II DNA/RNA helicase